ncbi:MAG TPA: MFS transporter, partial [Streptosporangiaceae bacterium]
MTARDLRRARLAVFSHFFVLGAAGATWSARLPAIKEALHLSDGALGLTLFAVPAGSVLTLMLSGRIVDRFGAARVERIAGLLVAAALVLVGLGPQFRSLPVLVVTLAWFGAVAGLFDVSLNTSAARLEAAYGRPIMSSMHAGFSIAGLAGAGIGGIFAALALGPLPTFASMAVPLAIVVLLAGRWVILPPLPAEAVRPSDQPSRSAGQIAAIIWVLGLLALAGQIGEGSAGDWSAVYLHANLGTSAGVATAGIAAFSVTMA